MKAIALLKSHQIHITELRLDLLHELLERGIPLDFEEFRTPCTKASFYRTMELFVNAGICCRVGICNRSKFLISERVRAFFHCENCHETAEIPLPPLGVHATSVVVNGICERCEEKPHEGEEKPHE